MIPRALKMGILVVALLLLGAVFAADRLRTGAVQRSETLAVGGLDDPVEILYDSMGVPHIFAGSVEDLHFAQGYVHATHRLWQMEMFRRVSQGRLSEMFGETTLEADRFLRTIGLNRAAEAGLPAVGSPMYRLMERYSLGVNAAIQGWSGPLPPEFVLLRLQPEPWSPVLSQGLEKIMAWDLSDYNVGLNLAAAREILGDADLAPLMPVYPDWGVTIVDGWPQVEAAEAERAGSARAALPPPPSPGLLAQARVPERAAALLELGSVVRASNSWVVGGQRSRSGKPVLANDMHLALNAPNIWFLIGLHAPGYDVVGMSLPGAPGVVVGHSNAVAWGFTNAMLDDSDFFLERVDPDQPDRYLTPDGWEPFETREEIIRVKGSEPRSLTVRSTRHGPVITPVEDRAGDQVLAFQWLAHRPAGTFQALLEMNQAKTVTEFVAAMEGFDNPSQNVVFADTAGEWGYWMGGRVPVRASVRPPHLPVPGWTGEHDWVGWVPFRDKPHILAPEKGYIATGNNAQGRGEDARRVTDGGWFAPYRAQRISQLIEATDLHDAQSLLAIQMDPGSAFVERFLPHALDAFRSADRGDLADRLMAWDGLADLDSREATLFHTWWAGLRTSLMDHHYGGERGYFPSAVLERALEGAMVVPAELPVEAARAAAEFADMPWGEAHQLTLDHPMAGVPIAGRILRFGRTGIPRAGGPNSVNVAGFSGVEPPFRVVYGPSQRHVVDLADPDGSGGFILPGGQSGFPDNPHSFDQLELWDQGRLWLLPLNRALVEGRTVATVRLQPGPS